jgi:hypothetical protein
VISKIILAFILIQSIAIASLFVMVRDVDSQSKLLPGKIDMLVDASQDKPVINLDCPECPKCPSCPECKDYTDSLKEIKKSIKKNGNQPGVYYYYGGCQ